MFGRYDEAVGHNVPFHLYSMRQAIEEGFIHDVLANYVTYQTYFKIEKAVEEDPEYDPGKAGAAIARFVTLHDYNLSQKAEVIVEHFRRHVAKIDRWPRQGDGRHLLAPARRADDPRSAQVRGRARLRVFEDTRRILRDGVGRGPPVQRAADERLP
jgi:hypothetical protein